MKFESGKFSTDDLNTWADGAEAESRPALDDKKTIREQIASRLKDIEEQEHVKILHAVESGSRAWGFASPDSDYDVRFIYVRQEDMYLRLEEQKDFIDWELNEVLDINGWDLQKVLRLFHKSNATLFEWANSPVVYKTTAEWQEIYQTTARYFSKKACMYQYYGTAKSNYHEFLLEEEVKYKKYFYVIRPLLACQWIEERGCPPPVEFAGLKDTMLQGRMKELVDQLLKLKMEMKETDKGKRRYVLQGCSSGRMRSVIICWNAPLQLT